MYKHLRSRVAIMILIVVVAWLFLMYSHHLVGRLRETVLNANRTTAWFWAGTQAPLSMLLRGSKQAVCSGCGQSRFYEGFESDSIRAYCNQCSRITTWYLVETWSEEEREEIKGHMRLIFQDLIQRLDYPTVMTDKNMVPQIVNGVPVSDNVSPESLAKYADLVGRLDAQNDPVPMLRAPDDTIGWLHYGRSELHDELAMVPYLELGLLAFLGLGLFLGLRVELRREKEMAWTGFAKETAHQLGTPLSSLMGWMELLRERPDLERDEDLKEALSSIRGDIERLSQIADRYGQLGKRPKLYPVSVNEVIDNILSYFRSRPGLMSENVGVTSHLDAEQRVMINPVLIGWVFENLLKNSLAAVQDRRQGRITVSTEDVEEGKGMVRVLFEDNGCGINFKDQGKIFRPGFSTRTGGWGLGLTVSKRIVERYHGGSIRLKASSPGKGTVFEILLRAESEGAEDDDNPLG
ncbi:hypothetical protein GF402_11475 [Candidatus Fermentibacteria bacterium]|nr:hypothetical protein [Candidatus Fermentibacteria bacterium]